MTIKTPSGVEAKLAAKLVTHLLATGCDISVFDGEQTTVTRSRVKKQILEAMGTTEQDMLVVWRGATRLGWVELTYGNQWDAMSNASVPMREELALVEAWVETQS